MYEYKQFIFFLCLMCLAKYSNEARILASVSTPSYSHQVAFRPIWKELANRGHEVVLLTTDPMEGDIKNLKQIDLKFSYEYLNKYNFSSVISNNGSDNFWYTMGNLIGSIGEAQRFQLQHPEVQSLIHNTSEYFDLFMLEIIFPIHLGFVERFKVPVIGLASLDVHRNVHLLMGNDDHLVMHPQLSLCLSTPPTFLERTVSNLYIPPKLRNISLKVK